MTSERGKGDGEDRISELADCVLCHILSFLPSEEAIATSLLSTRWRFLWRMVPALDFDCTKETSHERVNKFLSLRTTQRITRFRLNCVMYSYRCLPFMDKWFSAAINDGKVEHLNFSLCRANANDLSIWSMFTSTTIVSLNFKVSVRVSLPLSDVHLPSLKTLHIDNDSRSWLSGFEKFMYRCPALELFSQRSARFGDLEIVRSSRHIRLFERRGNGGVRFHLVIESDRDHFDFIPHYLDGHLETVVKAKVYITVCSAEFFSSRVNLRLFSALEQLRNVEFLSLADFRIPEKNRISTVVDLPQFQNLVQLQLYLKDAHSIFAKLPAQCPKLKDFEFVIVDESYDTNKRCPYHDLSSVSR